MVNNIPISTPPKQLGVLVSLVDRSCLLCNTFHVATTPVCLCKLPAAWRFSLDDCTWEDRTTRGNELCGSHLLAQGDARFSTPAEESFSHFLNLVETNLSLPTQDARIWVDECDSRHVPSTININMGWLVVRYIAI